MALQTVGVKVNESRCYPPRPEVGDAHLWRWQLSCRSLRSRAGVDVAPHRLDDAIGDDDRGGARHPVRQVQFACNQDPCLGARRRLCVHLRRRYRMRPAYCCRSFSSASRPPGTLAEIRIGG